MTSNEILNYAQSLMMRIRIALAYQQTYKALCDNGKKYKEGVNSAPVFFSITGKSLVTSLMIDMCKLFEDSKQVMSIKKLYNICEQNKCLFPQMRLEEGKETDIPCNLDYILEVTKEKFSLYETAISNLKIQRDKLWAHTDKSWILDTNQLESDYPIEWGEIEDLLEFASDFANSIIMCFTNAIEAPFFNCPNSCEEDVLTVLSCMMAGKKEQLKV